MCRSLLIAALVMGAALFSPHAPAEDLPSYQIVAKDGHFTPNRLEVPAGKRFKLLMRNDGAGPEEFESANPRMEKVLGPGTSSFRVVQPLKPGTYRIFGDFHPTTAECLIIAK